MHGLRPGDHGGRQDGLHVEVAVFGRRGANAHAFIRQMDMQRVPVRLGIDRDGADAHLPAGAYQPYRDLPAVGDEYLRKQGPIPPRLR
ncbi:hypothetical protein SDC9_189470 [bioreactor metagenome]|uniref:Uncharacterized protein n=1 Tax=bioreactor metagenome TaxID=1076179 RepID=A0A645HS90_9ZZZZ